MNHSFFMHVLNCFNDLEDSSGHKFLLTIKFFDEFSPLEVLHQQKDVVLIVKVSVQLDDVGVI